MNIQCQISNLKFWNIRGKNDIMYQSTKTICVIIHTWYIFLLYQSAPNMQTIGMRKIFTGHSNRAVLELPGRSAINFNMVEACSLVQVVHGYMGKPEVDTLSPGNSKNRKKEIKKWISYSIPSLNQLFDCLTRQGQV